MKISMPAIESDRKILVAVVLAWSGSLAHDLVEFGLPLPESALLNLLIYGVLCLFWLQNPSQRSMTGYLIMAWTVINILGAIFSVYPFAFLPFYPDQTIEHYGVHIYYGLTQLFLLWVMGQYLRRKA